MSAYPDRPNHFVELARKPQTLINRLKCNRLQLEPLYHVSSMDARSTLLARANGLIGVGRVTLVPEEVINLVPNDAGYRLLLAWRTRASSCSGYFSHGNVLPRKPQTGPYIANPWLSPFAEKLIARSPSPSWGAGLTMVDVALQLRGSEFVGPLIAISRRGLFTRTHSTTRPWPLPRLAYSSGAIFSCSTPAPRHQKRSDCCESRRHFMARRNNIYVLSPPVYGRAYQRKNSDAFYDMPGRGGMYIGIGRRQQSAQNYRIWSTVVIWSSEQVRLLRST